ncbi:glucuronate isomerase [Neolewinella antarctica]|uniref:Uronate isomerase n=1 Tax=Neolewinella antarctica TaxID=442734 RepID=A0ABX0XC90_9BACT|nr:glucuronate isomerase [Neolewinella antarctica]NJC26881.1 glucuronate isomerase [Neolewinella antarctica]
MKPFLDHNFILQTPTAERLYHDYAADLPIIDYHNHLSPVEVATNHQFANITEAWLKGDHYKWRAMRAAGIDERYITGDASDEEKFRMWGRTVPKTLRNPLYHWTHLELQRYFGVDELLCEENADEIFKVTSAQLAQPSHSAQGLLAQMKVEVICTTDNPTDSLLHHKKHRTGDAPASPVVSQDDNALKMLPTFRPDKFLMIGGGDYLEFLTSLEQLVDREIHTFEELVTALEERIDFFDSLGCKLSDHGLNRLYPTDYTRADLDGMMSRRRNLGQLSNTEQEQFQMALLHELGQMYHARDWTMQLHLGPIRNNNSRLLKLVGADVGCDSIGDYAQAEGLSAFFDRLDLAGKLPKTILYNLNPRDNELFATMAGNFNDGSLAGKIQWGSAWWFLDQKDGMEKQINALSNMGLLSQFVGMLTDSRSFCSFPRHEYFRRILCNQIGKDVHEGLLPNDLNLLGGLVSDVCYNNARNYFKFHEQKAATV